MQKTRTSSFRQRGYVEEGTTSVVVIYGDAPAPMKDGATYRMEWDHDIIETTIIADHIESGAV